MYYDTEDKKAYGIEGFYYNPDNNTFYSEDNITDENGRLIPMVFARDCNYISSYAIAKVGNDVCDGLGWTNWADKYLWRNGWKSCEEKLLFWQI